ncbi:MAG: cyclase family protein, partial [Gammaproteobacteria bacterium]|nr:cyclase family protein [Gemmatimonadota bacterium]NIU76970.1 cyclase family protein [Gammaproteobacteria bacterium]NIV88649.1 cyclase family protein [Actinomycetota bacterium]NIX22704.1 cyclase family protein [Actinomycetota bacterium]
GGRATTGQDTDWTGRPVVDLTHPFDEQTVYWPTAPFHFELDTLSYGETEGGWFYSAYRFRSPEHGGTHLDA